MGADKIRHKPSTKHTLEEVLRALQDLVRNELADAGPAGGKRTEIERPVAAEHEAAAADMSARPPDEQPVVEAEVVEIETTAPETEHGVSVEAVSATEDVAIEAPVSTDEPAADEIEPPVLTEIVTLTPAVAPEQVPAGNTERVWRAPEQTSINWDDIPVLNDAVEPHAGLSPARARDVAQKAVRRVNAELRKAGQSPLDPVIIDRLESALRDTLLGLAIEKQEPQRD